MDDAPKGRVVTARRRVWKSDLRAVEKLVMLALLEHWSPTTDTFPSCSRLAEFTGLSDRAVRASLGGLERAGFIGVSRRSGAVNRYDLSPAFREVETKAPCAAVVQAEPRNHVPRSKALPRHHVPMSTPAPHAAVEAEPRHDVPHTPAPRAAAPRHDVPPKRSIEEIQLSDPLSSGNPTTKLKEFYVEVFKQRKGVEPSWASKDHAKVGKAFKDLIDVLGSDLTKAKQVVRTALLDEWNSRFQPHEILHDRNKWLGEQPRAKTPGTVSTRAVLPQRGVAAHVRIARAEEVYGGAE